MATPTIWSRPHSLPATFVPASTSSSWCIIHASTPIIPGTSAANVNVNATESSNIKPIQFPSSSNLSSTESWHRTDVSCCSPVSTTSISHATARIRHADVSTSITKYAIGPTISSVLWCSSNAAICIWIGWWWPLVPAAQASSILGQRASEDIEALSNTKQELTQPRFNTETNGTIEACRICQL